MNPRATPHALLETPRFWLWIVLAELLLVAILAPDYYVQAWHLVVQLLHLPCLHIARQSPPTSRGGMLIPSPTLSRNPGLSVDQQ